MKQLWPVVPALLAGWWTTRALFPGTDGSLFTLAAHGLFTAAVTALTHGVCTSFRCFREVRELTFRKIARSIPEENSSKLS